MTQPRHFVSFRVLSLVCAACLGPVSALALPDTFTITVTNPKTSAPATLNLERYNLRAPGFHVRLYTDGTTNYTLLPGPLPEVPTYRGRVQGDSKAAVSAVIKPNGKLRAVVIYGNSQYGDDPVSGTRSWEIDNVTSGYYPSNNYAYAYAPNMPTTVSAGTFPAFTNGFGGPRYLNNLQQVIPRRCQLAIDVVYDFFANSCGSDVYTAIAQAESKVNDADLVTASNAKIAYQVTCVAVRTTVMDPYTSSGTARIGNCSGFWSSQRSTVPFDKVAAFTSIGGGVAYLWGDYSIEEASWYGGVICHEVGHNWGALDYEATKDYTGTNGYWHAMNGSGLTYCPESVNRAESSVRGKTYHEWIRYNSPLPPYATPDYATTAKNTPRTIDVLLNDFDVNSNTLAIAWFSTNSVHGGTLALAAGQLRYTPPTDFVGTDTFLYRVGDGTGFESTSQGMVLVTDGADPLLARWTFDETNGTTAAESTGRGVSGKLNGGLTFDQDGVSGLSGRALHCDGSGYVEFLNHYDPLDSSFSISIWVKPDATPTKTTYLLKKGYGGDAWGGINLVADASSFRLYGNMFGNLDGSKFSVVAGVVPQPDTWYHVVAELDRSAKLARLWVNGVEYTATANSRSLANGAEGEYVVGNGTLTAGNGFVGAVEDLRLYSKALTASEILALYTAAGDIPAGAPSPADAERNVPLSPSLAWLPGRASYQHDLFLGTNAAAVQAATTSSPEYVARLTSPSYTPLSPLLPNTQYFWRVNEVLNGVTVANGTVWSFYTAPDTIHGALKLQYSLDSRDTVGDKTYDRAGPPFSDATLSGSPSLVPGQVREAFDFNGTSQYVDGPALNQTLNTMTIVTWIKRSGTQNNYAGIVFWRGSSASGLDFSTGNQLGYHWNDVANTYNFGSKLIPPDGAWALAALVIEPTRAVIYLGLTDGTLSAATNNVSHGLTAFTSNFRLASDSSSSSRFFRGNLDEVGVWSRALSRVEIGQILTNGVNATGIDGPVTPPTPGTFTWIGNADNTWVNGANWAAGTLPGATDAVIFDDSAQANLDTQLAPAAFSVAGVLVTGKVRTVGIASVGETLTLGAGGLNLSNSIAAVTVGAPVILGANQTWRVSEFASLEVNAGLTNSGRSLVFTNAGTVTLDGVMYGAGGLSINGGGTVILNAWSKHSGQTTVNDGNLVLARGSWYNGSDLGTSTLVINRDGAVRTTATHVFDAGGNNPIRIYGGHLTFGAEAYVNSSFEMSGGLFDGPGEWRLRGNPAFRASAQTATLEVSQNFVGGSYTYTVENGPADPDLLVSGAIYNAVNFTKAGAGKMALLKAGAWSGTTTINQGVLQLSGSDDLLPVTTVVTISSGATLDLKGNNQAVAGLSGAGNVTLGGGGLSVNGNVAANFSGVIDGVPGSTQDSDTRVVPSGGLAKNGAGRFTLSNVQLYSGETWVAGGVLALSGAGSISNSRSINVAAGAALDVSARADGTLNLGLGQMLQGDATVVGKVLVTPGSTISPGQGARTLSTGSQTWQGGGKYAWEIANLSAASGRDLLSVAGSLTIQASPDKQFVFSLRSLGTGNLAAPLAGFDNQTNYEWIVATASGGIIGFDPAAITVDASGFGNDLGGGGFALAVVGNSLVLRFQPAPPVPPAISGSAIGADGSFDLTFTGTKDRGYRVLASADLSVPLSSWVVVTSGIFGDTPETFRDLAATNWPSRFYRVVSP